MPKLSEAEIEKRLVRLMNLERLYAKQSVVVKTLRAENKALKQMLIDQNAYFEAIIETQAARITELEIMVFGRRPKGGIPVPTTNTLGSTKSTRSAASYRRPLPPAAAITAEEHHATANCHRCGHTLTNKQEAIRYEEDIILAALSPDTPHQTVTKHVVETGWCSHCGQMSSARDLRGQTVTIGPVVRSLIVYLVVQADQTYAQTQDLLWQLYRFKVSSSEIATVLASRRTAYLPVYEQLKASVRAGPAHLDETSYPIQLEQGAGYAHVMVGVDGTPAEHDVVYRLADSRGKGHAKDLLGIQGEATCQQVGITDRYGAYKHLFVALGGGNLHQICWAHLHRTARDLTHLACLNQTKLRHVTVFYQQLATIYGHIREYRAEPFDQVKREQQASELLDQVQAICQSHQLDPKKLANLKAGILDYQNCLFLCLTIDGIPADNNKAERALRKLVIKRKKSFGVKTQKGARTMEVLLSVSQSLYNRDKDNFLPALHALATLA